MRGWNGWSDVVLFVGIISFLLCLRIGWAKWAFNDMSCAFKYCVTVKP